MKPIVERIQNLMTAEGLNSSQLADKLQYNSPEKISRLFRKEDAMPSAEIIIDIANKFELIDKEWFLTGKGGMYKTESTDASQSSEEDLSFLKLEKAPPADVMWDRIRSNYEEIMSQLETQTKLKSKVNNLSTDVGILKSRVQEADNKTG